MRPLCRHRQDNMVEDTFLLPAKQLNGNTVSTLRTSRTYPKNKYGGCKRLYQFKFEHCESESI